MTRVGVVGIGFMGWIHWLAYRRVQNAKVVAICETIPERLTGDWTKIKGNFGPAGEKVDLSNIKAYDNLDKMLADPEIDMVDICLPPAAHASAVIKALSAGKHVFCEKPISLAPTDADRMVEAAKQNGKILQIGHVLPFFPAFKFLYDAVQDGRYGKLIGGHFKRITSDPTWIPNFYDPNVAGGPMLDLHVHDAHFIRVIAGMPKTVKTIGRMRGDVAELFSTQFTFADSPIFITAACGNIKQQGRPFTAAFEVYFEKATLCNQFAGLVGVDPVVVPLTVLKDDGTVERPNLGENDDISPFAAEITEVIRAVEAGKPSPILDGALAKDALKLCAAETKSLQHGSEYTL